MNGLDLFDDKSIIFFNTDSTRKSLTVCKRAIKKQNKLEQGHLPNFLIGGLKDLSLKFEQDRLSYKLV